MDDGRGLKHIKEREMTTKAYIEIKIGPIPEGWVAMNSDHGVGVCQPPPLERKEIIILNDGRFFAWGTYITQWKRPHKVFSTFASALQWAENH